MTTEIPLSQGLVAVIDEADLPLVQGRRWFANPGRKTYYARSGGSVLMHRMLLGAPKGIPVDHIKGNGLDNRRRNLRLCSNAQNQWNAGARRDSVTGHRGVSFRRDTKRFCAHIRVHGRRFYLGEYRVLEDAIQVYNAAARTHFGEFLPSSLSAEAGA